MGALDVLSGIKLLGSAKISIATVTTTKVDFGTPDDLNLAALANYRPGDRVLVVIHATTAGTTDTTAFTIKDAPDSAGSIGTTADAAVTMVTGALAGTTGNQYLCAEVQLKAGRPWLSIAAVRASGTTDTLVVTATVFSVPRIV
jgi:hypothetical protein